VARGFRHGYDTQTDKDEWMRTHECDIEGSTVSVVQDEVNDGGGTVTMGAGDGRHLLRARAPDDPVGVPALGAPDPGRDSERRADRRRPMIIALVAVVILLLATLAGTVAHNRNPHIGAFLAYVCCTLMMPPVGLVTAFRVRKP